MTIDELFAKAQSRAAENVQFVIDENLRIITVPESAAVFGVETDKDVNTASFTINRFYSEVDLSEFSIRVSFANANNEMDFFDATDITVEDSTVSFNWLMGASAFKYKGNIQFAVNFFKADSAGTIQQAYNTTIATGQCLSGLNVNTADLPDTDYSELILHIQQQIQQTGQEQVQAVQKAGAQQLSHINAANAHPPQPNTATGVWQTWDAETGQYVDTTAPYRGQGVPDPTPADAGKVPVVNAEGTGYALEEIPTGGGGTGQPGADGEDGGYYTPSVDTAGNLSWTPSKAGMPSVPDANIRGPEGPQGDPGPTGPDGPPYTLTEEDKRTIVQAVIAALPDGDAVSYGTPEPGIVTTDNQYYTAIAAAIRQKLGTSTEYQPAQMAAAIESIGAAGTQIKFSGNPIVATDTIESQPFAGLKIYGKTAQDETAGLVSAGESGSIALSITGSQQLPDQDISNFYVNANGSKVGISSGEVSKVFATILGQTYFFRRKSAGTRFRVACVSRLPQGTGSSNLVPADSKAVNDTAQELSITSTSKYIVINLDSEKAFDGLMVSLQDYAEYQAYQSQSITIPSKLPGVPVSSSGNCTDSTGQAFTSDYWDFEDGLQHILCGQIDSYNGDEITTPYISNTGDLTTGAQVVYVLPEPQTQPIPAETLAAYHALTTYANTTVISTAEPVATMEATVYCDAGATIQRLQGEIQTLSDATALNTQTLNTMLGAE